MIEAINVTKSFLSNGTPTHALQGVSLKIHQGEFLALIGRSGSGKSTMLNLLATLMLPDSGTISYNGQDIGTLGELEINKLRQEDFAVIFQFHHLMPYLTAEENTLLPFMNSYYHVSEQHRAKAKECLRRVGLSGKEHRLPGELSGGEQQRVAIARALVKDTKVLLADEPTGSLDKTTGEEIIQLLADLNRGGLTIVMVTHDPHYAQQATRIVEMEDGAVI